ncbi:hypothetical protein RHMOL_Rhmol11G0085200 [Rhododendron molle]|uniref:Uncharacterized protein n=1 Tax=Rhododendron molle TaxID=49168 RepID=A0ACC0LQ84_RHOML|nr:hypothetical protein RHMOL_Rhmol11G0085200 [Rhododendron molle]
MTNNYIPRLLKPPLKNPRQTSETKTTTRSFQQMEIRNSETGFRSQHASNARYTNLTEQTSNESSILASNLTQKR